MILIIDRKFSTVWKFWFILFLVSHEHWYYELISSYDSQYSSLALINFVTLSLAELFYVSNLLENSSKTQYSPEIVQVDVTPYPLARGSAL